MGKNSTNLLFISFILRSCTHNYEDSVMDDEFSEKTPESIVYNFKEVVIKEGKPSYILEADKAATYGETKSIVFTDLYFIEYNSKGEVATEGACIEAEYFFNTDNIEFRKKMVLSGSEQGFFIEGEYLFWDNELRLLSGKGNTPVRIRDRDGSFIKGNGFLSSAETRSFSFSEGIKGKYVSTD